MTESEEINALKKRIDAIESEKAKYEKGDAKLYYALQRKMSEMANALNKYNLESVDISDKSEKTFDRIILMLQKCETISASAKGLGEVAGVTGDEAKDTKVKNILEFAESRQ